MKKEVVFLVHGFLGSPIEFLPLKARLQKQGLFPLSWGHFTLNKGIEGHSFDFYRWVLLQMEVGRWDVVHFVGHSMGAIIVRRTLSILSDNGFADRLGRVVLLAPPNRGSYVAGAIPLAIKSVIPVIGDLSDDPNSYVNALPRSLPVEAGIIRVQDDHLIKPSAAIIPVSGGAVEVRGWHSGILYDREVSELTARFLRHGDFLIGDGDGEFLIGNGSSQRVPDMRSVAGCGQDNKHSSYFSRKLTRVDGQAI